MPFDQWHRDQLKDVQDIINKQHLRVVLAHVERYEGMQKDRYVWDSIINMPLTIQMNAGSFISSFTSGMHTRHTAKFCFGMLKEFDNCIIGTDCHNLTDRAPNLADARAAIEKKAGASRLRQLDEYTEGLLG
jgi:protein-tyrosine phosphatase